MSSRERSFGVLICVLLLGATVAAAGRPKDDQTHALDRQFQTAVAAYEAGKYADAATQLEDLLPHAPRSYEIHELLGLVYAPNCKMPKPLSISRPQSD